MLNIIKNTINRVFASGVDSDASAFITATGLSGTTQKSAITTLVKDLKASGLWSKMKAVYPMITDNYNTRSYSEDFTNAYWLKYNSTVTGNTAVAPNGTLTADSLIEDTSNNAHSIYLNETIPTNTQYTSSIYVKYGTRRYFQLSVTPTTSDWAACVFDLIDGVFTKTQSSGGVTATYASSSVGNGWYRVSITWTTTVGGFSSPITSGLVDIPNPTLGAFAGYSYIGNNSFVYIWGAQTQLGTLSTYQPILTTPSAFMASQMKYNLKDARDLDAAFRLTWSGGWTYSATGATPNGTNAYADTKLNALSNLTLANSHFSYYSRTNVQNDAFVGLTASAANNGLQLYLRGVYYTDQIQAIIGDSNASNIIQVANTNSTGLFTINRNSTSNANLFKNNSKIGSTTYTVSGNYVNNTIYLASRNSGGSPNTYDTRQIAFISIGDGLTDQDTLLLNQIVEKYQVALSRGVQAAQSFYYNSAYSNEANTYLYSTQITGTTQVSAINTLINGLKANNLWAKMKAVYPFVTDYRNLLSYTEDFSNGFWNKFNSTVTANTIIAPNGTLTADTLQENTTNTEHNVRTDLNGLIPSETYTYSNYVKYNDRRYMRIQVFYNGGIYPNYAATFDILNGVFVSQFGVSGATIIGSSITADNNGWYRITVSGQLGAFSSNIAVQTNLLNDSLAQVYTGTSKSTYIWGAQFELGSSATAYQPVLAANSSSTFMSSQMKFNLVNPQDSDAAFRLAFSGGWTYSTNGAQPNGTNGYADTKLGQTAAGMFANSHLSFYSRTNSTTATSQVEMGVGATVGGTFTNLLMRLDTTTNYIGGSVGSRNALSTSANSNGYVIVNALTAAAKAFKNGALIATDTATQTGALNTLPIYIGCQNNNSIAGQFSSRQAAFASIGDGLSDAEAAVLYQLIQQYQTDLSRQV